jgi:hypothetical protein
MESLTHAVATGRRPASPSVERRSKRAPYRPARQGTHHGAEEAIAIVFAGARPARTSSLVGDQRPRRLRVQAVRIDAEAERIDHGRLGGDGGIRVNTPTTPSNAFSGRRKRRYAPHRRNRVTPFFEALARLGTTRQAYGELGLLESILPVPRREPSSVHRPRSLFCSPGRSVRGCRPQQTPRGQCSDAIGESARTKHRARGHRRQRKFFPDATNRRQRIICRFACGFTDFAARAHGKQCNCRPAFKILQETANFAPTPRVADARGRLAGDKVRNPLVQAVTATVIRYTRSPLSESARRC